MIRFFRLKCDWCQGIHRNVVHFDSPNSELSIQIQVNNKQIQIGVNGELVGGIDAKYCPVCGGRLKSET